MKVTLKELLVSENVMGSARGRGTFPVNYAIEKNHNRLMEATRMFIDAQSEEPMRWYLGIENPQAPNPEEAPTEEQIAEGKSYYEKALAEEVEFEPYKIHIGKLCDELKAFSPARERLTPEQIVELNENFTVALSMLDIIEDGEK